MSKSLEQYIDDLRKEIDTIPKQHRKQPDKIIKISINIGRSEVKNMLGEIHAIPTDKLNEYGGDFMRDVFVAPDVVRFLLDELDGKYSPEDPIKPDKLMRCPDCEGEGKVPIGERLVTREMALDAGDPKLEGTHFDYEYAACDACEGDGRRSAESEESNVTK